MGIGLYTILFVQKHLPTVIKPHRITKIYAYHQ